MCSSERKNDMKRRNTILTKLSTYFSIAKKTLKDSKKDIEKKFSDYIGLRCCFTYSGRSALYLIYKSLGIKEGEVITTPLTCFAAIYPIIYCGLKPKFVDIDPETFNIQPDKIKEAITKDTKVIQVVHLAGNPCDMKPINEICEEHNLILIEDCAQALCAEYCGKKVGTFGDVAIFSFAKPPLCIRGGVIVSKHPEIISKIDDYQRKFLPNVPISIMRRDFGIPFKIFGKITSLKYNNYHNFFESFLYRPNKLLAAISLSKLGNLKLLEGYMQSGLLLTEELKKLDGIGLQRTTRYSNRVFTKFMITLKISRNCVEVIKKLRERGIYATHLTTENDKIYQQRFDKYLSYLNLKCSVEKCVNYLNIHDQIVTLPIFPYMSKVEVKFYYEQLGNIIKEEEE